MRCGWVDRATHRSTAGQKVSISACDYLREAIENVGLKKASGE